MAIVVAAHNGQALICDAEFISVQVLISLSRRCRIARLMRAVCCFGQQIVEQAPTERYPGQSYMNMSHLLSLLAAAIWVGERSKHCHVLRHVLGANGGDDDGTGW